MATLIQVIINNSETNKMLMNTVTGFEQPRNHSRSESFTLPAMDQVLSNCLVNFKTLGAPDNAHVDVIHTQSVTLGESTMPWPLFSERLSANKIDSDKEQGNLGLPYPSRYLSMPLDKMQVTAPSFPRNSNTTLSQSMISTTLNCSGGQNDLPNITIN